MIVIKIEPQLSKGPPIFFSQYRRNKLAVIYAPPLFELQMIQSCKMDIKE